MRRNNRSGTRRRERGIAMVVCLFALMLLSAIGVSLMYMANTETQVNSNYRDAQTAYFDAYAGLQEARERLLAGATNAITPPATLPTSSSGMIYITNKKPGETITPWNGGKFIDDQLCHEAFPGLSLTDTGANVPCGSAPTGTPSTVDSNNPYFNTDGNLNYKWVRITEKTNASNGSPYYVSGSSGTSNTIPVCWDGVQQLPLPGGSADCDTGTSPSGGAMKTVYRLTSLAVAPAGSRRMLQMEVAKDPPVITNAAVDSQDHVTLNGQLGVNAYDYCSCQCTTTGTGTKKTTTCTSRAGTTCDASKWAIYSSQTVDDPNNSETLISGQPTPIPPCAQTGSTTPCPWNYDIAALVNRYKTATGSVWTSSSPYNYTCTGTPANCGTQDAQTFGVPPYFNDTANPPGPSPVDNPTGPSNMAAQVTYVPGSLHMTGGSVGNGILVVDGDLVIDGGLQFYGLVLVKGVIKFSGGGSDKTNIYGAVLAGQQSIDDSVLGGSANIYFDMCAIKRDFNPAPPRLLVMRELTY